MPGSTPLRTAPTPRLTARAEALSTVHRKLDARLDAEMKRPLPCQARIQRLKRMKLRAKDEIASIQGLVRALDRGRAPRLQDV